MSGGDEFEASTVAAMQRYFGRYLEMEAGAPTVPVVCERPTHTITETPWADGSSLIAHVRWTPACDLVTRECGGRCVLAPYHLGMCECGGDEPGEPGSCPA